MNDDTNYDMFTEEPYPGAYPHLVYYTTDDGVYYHCAFCGFDRNLGFYGNTNDAARARDAHDATACPRRELPTGVDQDDLDEAEHLRRQLRQELQDAAEAARNQPPPTKRKMPALEEQLLHEMTKPLTGPSIAGGFFMLPERLPPQDDGVETLSQKITDFFRTTAPPFLFPDGKNTILPGTTDTPTHEALYEIWYMARDEILSLIDETEH